MMFSNIDFLKMNLIQILGFIYKQIQSRKMITFRRKEEKKCTAFVFQRNSHHIKFYSRQS